jgi:hypothetical protein
MEDRREKIPNQMNTSRARRIHPRGTDLARANTKGIEIEIVIEAGKVLGHTIVLAVERVRLGHQRGIREATGKLL